MKGLKQLVLESLEDEAEQFLDTERDLEQEVTESDDEKVDEGKDDVVYTYEPLKLVDEETKKGEKVLTYSLNKLRNGELHEKNEITITWEDILETATVDFFFENGFNKRIRKEFNSIKEATKYVEKQAEIFLKKYD